MANKKIAPIFSKAPSKRPFGSPIAKPKPIGKTESSNGKTSNGNAKAAVEILREIRSVDESLNQLENRHNLLLRDLRSKTGKTFRHEGRTFQIRRRGSKYYLAEISAGEDIGNQPVKKLG